MTVDNDYMKNRLRDFFIKNKKHVDNEENKEFREYLDFLYNKNITQEFDIESAKIKLLNILQNSEQLYQMHNVVNNPDFLWGTRPTKINLQKTTNKNLTIVESAFLYSIVNQNVTLEKNKLEYSTPVGYLLDDMCSYYDGTRPSRMECILNSDYTLTSEQIERAKICIKKIIENKITKYNHQPISTPKIGREGVSKVLVIDQSYGDYSIVKGCASDKTFELMLQKAIKENPESDILIKTHPDALDKMSIRPQCYYSKIESKDNIYRLTEPINPISLIQYSDKVYVCTSQFGFEALMCGKEVHTFGMPFYANWGLTIDDQKCHRRNKTRTLEEIFYIAYILMSCYYNHDTNNGCEIEEVLDLILKLRTQYFDERKI